MGTKLKDLRIKKVDFVDAGANPDAHIVLVKRKPGEPGEPPQKGGVGVLAEGEQGKLSLPTGPHRLKGGESKTEKGQAIVETLKRLLGIAKEDSRSFGEALQEMQLRDVTNQVWDVVHALSDSLCSILREAESDRAALMNESLGEFAAAVKGMIPRWAAGEAVDNVSIAPPEAEPAALALTKRKLEALLEKTGEPGKKEKDPEKDPDAAKEEPDENDKQPTKKTNLEGDGEMKVQIDKSKLPQEQQAQLDALLKAAGATVVEEPAAAPAEPPVAKSNGEPAGEDDIYKGLHPKAAAELQALRKFKEAAEERELTDLAKRYEIIGKKAEDLVPIFKSLKAAGGNLFDSTVATLDDAVAAVEKSGLFTEMGKAWHGGENEPERVIEKQAAEIMKSQPELTWHQATALAWEQNPEMAVQYEKDRKNGSAG